MLQALGILGGAFQGWQQGKDDQQRRRLRDLRIEGAGLRNEGYRLGNTGQEYQNRVLAVEAETTEYLRPFVERAQVAATEQAEEAVLTQEASTYANNTLGNLRSAQTIGRQIENETSRQMQPHLVRKAEGDANQAATAADQSAHDLLVDKVADVSDRMATQLELADHSLPKALQNDQFVGGLRSYANLMFDVKVNDIEEVQGGLRFTDAEGQTYDVSEQEVMSFIADPDSVAGIMEGVSGNRQLAAQQQEDAARVDANTAAEVRELGTSARNALGNAKTADALVQGHEQLTTQQRVLEEAYAHVEAQLAEAGGGSTGGARDAMALGVQSAGKRTKLRDQLVEIETELGKVNQMVEGLEYTNREALTYGVGGDGWLDHYDATQERVDQVVGGREQQLTGLARLGGQAVEDSNVNGESPVDNYLARSDRPSNTLTPSEVAAAESTQLGLTERRNELVRSYSDGASEAAQIHIDTLSSSNDSYRPKLSPAQVGANVDGWLANNPEVFEEANRNPRAASALNALLRDAATLSVESGVPAASIIDTAQRYEREGSREAFFGVFDSDYWNSDSAPRNQLGREQQMNAANIAADVYEDARPGAMTVQQAINYAITKVQSGNAGGGAMPSRPGQARPTLDNFRQ